MTTRKKKGIGFVISGVVFLGVGGVFIGLDATPQWVALIVQAVGLLAGLLGFTTVFPDTED